MSTAPSSQDRPQPPSRPPARWKDATIAVLAVLLVGVSGLAFKDKLASAGSWFRPKPKGDQVAVFNVVMDRKNRAYVDILFDNPLGQGKAGGGARPGAGEDRARARRLLEVAGHQRFALPADLGLPRRLASSRSPSSPNGS